MTIHQEMADIFQTICVPGFLQEWRATSEYPQIPDKFCVYIVTLEAAELCADDAEWIHSTCLSIAIYGKTDIGPEYAELIGELLKRGFCIQRVRDKDDVREGEYQYHKQLDIVSYESYDSCNNEADPDDQDPERQEE